MVASPTQTPAQVQVNAWIPADWEKYLVLSQDPSFSKAKGYYYNDHMRIEMGVGPDHARRDHLLALSVTLFGVVKGVSLTGMNNCSYRKSQIGECQPDLSYYIGERAPLAPTGLSVVDLDDFDPPDLVVEISASSLSDDIGPKRLLYEDMGVREYWVVDVKGMVIIAFQIISGGSVRLSQSQVLPGLNLSLLQKSLTPELQQDHSQAAAWLMEQFRSL